MYLRRARHTLTIKTLITRLPRSRSVQKISSSRWLQITLPSLFKTMTRMSGVSLPLFRTMRVNGIKYVTLHKPNLSIPDSFFFLFSKICWILGLSFSLFARLSVSSNFFFLSCDLYIYFCVYIYFRVWQFSTKYLHIHFKKLSL